MPSLKPEVAFFAVIMADNGRILNDDYFKNMYALEENHFEQRSIRGVSSQDHAALTAFFTAAMAREDDKRAAFLAATENFSSSHSKHQQGRQAASQWFRSQKIAQQIYSAIDAVLKDNDVHPQQLIEDNQDIGEHQLPDEGGIHSIIETPVAEAVFGQNALTGIAVPATLRTSIGAFMHHAWERYRKCRKRAHSKMLLRRSDYEAAIKDLEHPSVKRGVGELRSLLRSVKNYEDSILWHPTEGGADVSQAKCIIEGMMVMIGKEPKPRADKTNRQAGRQRASKLLPVELATAEEIKSIWTLYLQLFEPESELCNVTLPAAGGDSTGLDEWENDCDLGMGEFASKTEEQLMALLAWPRGAPPIFAEYRSIHGWSEWDDKRSEEFAEKNASVSPEMKRLRLLWHQLGCASAVLEKLFTDSDITVPGVLVADGVGLGKTAEVMGVIAGIIQVWKGEQIQPHARPPLLANTKSFCGKGPVPDLPHAIVVPLTLIDQWYSELRTFFKRHSIDIFRFPSAAKDFASFWDQGSPWELSRQPKIKRIVLIAHSTIGLQAGQMLTTAPGTNKKKTTSDPRRAAAQARRHQPYCLWNMNWASVIVDEAHLFRTPGRLFHGMNALCDTAHAIILVTATPLYHSPKDLSNLARLMRLPSFLGKDGDNKDKEFTNIVATEKKKVSKGDRDAARDLSLRVVRGEKVDDVDDPYAGIKAASKEWVKDIQRRYLDRVIRRDASSKRFDGAGINDALPPYQQFVAAVKLRIDEIEQLDREIKKMEESKYTATSLQTMSSAFYLQYRTRNAYPYGDTAVGYKPVNSLDDWTSRSGTKIDLLMKLVQHCLQSDDIAMPTFTDDGTANWPPLLDLAHGLQHPQTRKILVSQEFPMMADMIQSVFRVHGIECEVLNGSLSQKERTEAAERFRKDPKVRVLLVSSVGGVGLNLTEADTVICFDILWTTTALKQLIGRCHRFGQTNVVTVFILVALETVDVLMVDQSHAKGTMLETFLTKEGNKGLVANILGEVSEEDGGPVAMSSTSTSIIAKHTNTLNRTHPQDTDLTPTFGAFGIGDDEKSDDDIYLDATPTSPKPSPGVKGQVGVVDPLSREDEQMASDDILGATSSSTSPHAGDKRDHPSSPSPVVKKLRRSNSIHRPNFFQNAARDGDDGFTLPASIGEGKRGRGVAARSALARRR